MKRFGFVVLGMLLCITSFVWADAVSEVEGLVGRLVPEYKGKFCFEVIDSDNGRDVFEIESCGGKVVIGGNNGVSMAMGLNWYLKYYCRCHVSWCGNQLDMPAELPIVENKIRKVSWAKYRYMINYCCFGYSVPWWNWEQWERLVDWMALNGVNMPLVVTGQEAVWQAVCKRLGMSDEQVKEFLAGPPYLPFQWMGCLDGFGGPLPQSWIDEHEELGKKILARQRGFGMKPVLQGFTGHVPGEIKNKYPDVELHEIHWAGWTTYLIDPLDERFSEVAKIYLQEQRKRFGTDHYYAADPFVEMTPPKGDGEYLDRLGKAIYGGMSGSDKEAVWVFQGWPFMFKQDFWKQERVKALLDSVDNKNMVVLDMFCEAAPQWSRTEAFYGKDWLWNNVYVFGNVIDFGGGSIKVNHRGISEARKNPASGNLAGLGFVNEGLGYNPIDFDLMYEMAWREESFDLEHWKVDYFHYRYGKLNKGVVNCWNKLLPAFWVYQNRSIIESMPTLEVKKNRFDEYRDKMVEGWGDMIGAAAELGKVDSYRFDLVNISRGMLSYYNSIVHRKIAEAYENGDVGQYRKWVGEFMEVMLDIDDLLQSRKEFLLGCWLEDAKRWGKTAAEKDKFEWNARMILTLWGRTSKFMSVNDCGRKMWAGMVRDYYLKRWEMFFEHVSKAMRDGGEFDKQGFDKKLFKWMEQWSGEQRKVYTTETRGDSVEKAKGLWLKYSDKFKQIEIVKQIDTK